MRTDWKVIDKDTPRLESFDKISGGGVFTDDIALPGMVFGAILHSPHAHAKVLRIDAKAAAELTGVLAVLLPEEVEDIRYNSSGNPPSDLLIKDERILTDHPLFEGDRVAAVVAVTPEICRAALDLIEVEYQVLPAILDVDAAVKADAPPIHPECADGNDFIILSFDAGDIEEGLAGSEIILEDTFETPAIHPLPLEPTGCICDWRIGDEITIHSTSQTIFQERRLLAEMFGLPENKIRIIKPLMGGGFGARQQLHHQPVGCLLSKKIKRPVKMILTREEEMLATTARHGAKMRVRLGADRTGRILALDAEVYHDTGAYCTHGPIILAAQGKKTAYDIPHYRYRGHCVYTNNLPAGAMRGYGNPQLTFAREMLIDRLARELDMDPIELRLKNHLKAGDLVPGTATVVTSCAIQECVEEAIQIRKEIDAKHTDSACWGTAFCMHTSGPSNKSGLSSASIYVNHDGSVQLNIGSADIGQGCETALSQVAAEVLGIPLSHVNVHAADTRSTPYDTGTFASSQMFVGGNAVLKAAKNTLESMTDALAKTKKIPREDIRFESGVFTLPDSELSFGEAARMVLFGGIGGVVFGEGVYKAEEAPPVFAVCMVRARRDALTGVITVTDIIETVDVGTVINRNIVKGQIEGGVVQGLGYGWMEQCETDRRVKKNYTSDALFYKIPTAADIPNLHAESVPSFDPHGPLGAKSIGELTLVPVSAAMAVCAERLTGKTVNRLPMSRQFLFKASQEDATC